MKVILSITLVCLALGIVSAQTSDDNDKKEVLVEEARSMGSSRTFDLPMKIVDKLIKLALLGEDVSDVDSIIVDSNAISSKISKAIITGLVIVVPIVLIVVAIGAIMGYIDFAGLFSQAREDTFDYEYDNFDYSSYSSYAQRSLNMVAPIVKTIAQAYEKYERSL